MDTTILILILWSLNSVTIWESALNNSNKNLKQNQWLYDFPGDSDGHPGLASIGLDNKRTIGEGRVLLW
jgi:hypothetical protein